MSRARAAGGARAVALLAAAATLWIAGRQGLPAPPVHRPGQLSAWAAALGPAGTAMAFVRVAAMSGAAVLGATTGLVVLAGAGGGGRPIEALIRRLPRPAVRLVTGLAGLSLTAGISVAGASAPSGEPDTPHPVPGEATMHRLADAPSHPRGVRGVDQVPRATMDRLAGGSVEWMAVAPQPTEARLRALPDESDPATARLRSLDDAGAWTVEPGESFWSIAVDHLTDLWGRPPSVAEVTPYWAELVELNRARLVTGDPDLIYPGQQLQLAPVP